MVSGVTNMCVPTTLQSDEDSEELNEMLTVPHLLLSRIAMKIQRPLRKACQLLPFFQ